MRPVNLEYERMIKNPRFSEAIDNVELGILYEWINCHEYLEALVEDHEHAHVDHQRRHPYNRLKLNITKKR